MTTSAASILIVDDDLNTLKMVEQFLHLKKYQVTACLTFADAQREIKRNQFAAAVLDYFMPDTTGLDMMRALHEALPGLPVIILTASRDVKIAVDCVKNGAFGYLVKPVDPDELYVTLDKAFEHRKLAQENRRLKLDLKDRYKFEHIVGQSGRMMEVFDLTARAAKVRSNILILGETGAGKELIAKAIHYNSGRAAGPFIGVNCSALAESLLEAELFGIEKNVATGVDARIGKFEAANGGTLFLDEIGDMAANLQAKALRAMQEREIERVGSHAPHKVDIRIIAATNRDLPAMIERGEFRQDLFYRLNVLVIPVPPLRERREDIPALCEFFLAKFCAENRLAPKRLGADALALFMASQWPGNVRELENTIERAVIMCDGDTVTARHLPPHFSAVPAAAHAGGNGGDILLTAPLEEMVNDFERRIILKALEDNDWRQNRAADALGVTERSIWYKIKKLGIETRRNEREPEE